METNCKVCGGPHVTGACTESKKSGEKKESVDLKNLLADIETCVRAGDFSSAKIRALEIAELCGAQQGAFAERAKIGNFTIAIRRKGEEIVINLGDGKSQKTIKMDIPMFDTRGHGRDKTVMIGEIWQRVQEVAKGVNNLEELNGAIQQEVDSYSENTKQVIKDTGLTQIKPK